MKTLDEWLDFLDFDYDFNFMDDDKPFATDGEIKTEFCTHDWVDVGFMHSKIVCKHCDIEKEVWEKGNPLIKRQGDIDCD